MIALFLTVFLLTAAPDRPDLVGRVVDEGGKPVVGAHVLINSAGVRQGTSALCPSCYLDCRKRAETGGAGEFRITSVDPELIFNVLVVADGYRPAFAPKSDPTTTPIEISLKAFDPTAFPANRILRGVVLAPDGSPLVGAKVTPGEISTEAFTGFGPNIFDPVAFTNLAGEFVLTSKSPIYYADLLVEGNGICPAIARARKPKANPHTLKTTPGATLTGRLVRDGAPVAGATVGLIQADRNAENHLGNASIGTDRDGRFTFLNVHPEENYYVYSLMGSIADGGNVPAQRIHVGGEETTTKLGDLDVVPGHRVTGRVLLSDEKTVPRKTRLLLSREHAWDSTSVELDADGGFTFTGLPTERYSLSVTLKGYHVSPKNRSIDALNPWLLVGTIDQDIDGLKILMEPGDR